MTEISVAEARKTFSDILNRAYYRKTRTVITRKGRKWAIVCPIEDLDLLEKMEDEIDRKLIRKALKEKSKAIPYERVRKEMGLK